MATNKQAPALVVSVKGDGSTSAAAGKLLADSQSQAILMYLAGTVAGEVIKATYAAGSKPMFYGMSIVPGEVTAKVVQLQASGLAISQVMPYPWGEVETVAREYRRLAGMDIDFTAGNGTGSRFIEMVRVTPEGRFVR